MIRRALRSVAQKGLVGSLVAGAAGACVRPGAPGDGLEGEWEITLQFTAPGAAARPASIAGRLVLDSRLPSYGLDVPPGTLLGRAYVDLSTPIRGGEVRKGPHYSTEAGADLHEEVNARLDSAGVITIEISPQVFGSDPVLTATRTGTTIIGQWTYFSHEDTLGTGSFVMRRAQRSSATDSAVVRARRAAKQWNQERKENFTSTRAKA
jgi:hypothetical protein